MNNDTMKRCDQKREVNRDYRFWSLETKLINTTKDDFIVREFYNLDKLGKSCPKHSDVELCVMLQNIVPDMFGIDTHTAWRFALR